MILFLLFGMYKFIRMASLEVSLIAGRQDGFIRGLFQNLGRSMLRYWRKNTRKELLIPFWKMPMQGTQKQVAFLKRLEINRKNTSTWRLATENTTYETALQEHPALCGFPLFSAPYGAACQPAKCCSSRCRQRGLNLHPLFVYFFRGRLTVCQLAQLI